MIKILKGNYLLLVFFLFFLVITSIYFWPFLKEPAFNLIDDGMSLKVSKEILSGDFSNLIEVKNGRARPLYWLYFTSIYIFSGINPLGFWIGQTVVFAMTLFSIWYLLTNKINRNKWGSYLISLALSLFFFIPSISENLFRLGTAEVRQTLFLILFMIWMKQSMEYKIKSWIGFLILILAVLTKETSILLIPMFFIFLFPYITSNYKKYKNRLCSLLFLSFFSLIFYSLIMAMKENSTYSAGFSVSLAQIKLNLLVSRLNMSEIYYSLIFFLTLSITRFSLFLFNKKIFSNQKEGYKYKMLIKFWKKNSLLVATLAGLFSSLFFIFSWGHQLDRYYYPIYIFLFIYIILETQKSLELFFNLKTNKHKILIIVFPFLVLPILYATLFQKTLPNTQKYFSINTQIKNRWFFGYQNSYNIIKVLLKEDISKMYTLTADYEVVYELGLFTNKLDYQKGKIPILSPNKDVTVKNNYLFYLEDIESAFLEDNDKNVVLITTNSNDVDLDANYYSRELLINKYSDRNNWIVWRKK